MDAKRRRRGPKGGNLRLLVGCMFSGKSSEVIRQLDRWTGLGLRCAVIKPSVDTREDRRDAIVTHDKESSRQQAAMSMGPGDLTKFTQVLSRRAMTDAPNCWPITAVLVDEAQFFDPDELERNVRQWLYVHNLHVLVAALDSDYLGRPWPATQRLYGMATTIDKLLAVCGICGSPNDRSATHTQRTTKEIKVYLLVAGGEAYSPRCNACFVWPKEGQPVPKDDRAFGFDRQPPVGDDSA